MGDTSLGAGLAALGFWGFVAVIVVAGIWAGIRKKEAQHETLRSVIESGQPLDQTLMEKLLPLGNGTDEHLDLHLKIGGLIVLFFAAGLALLGWIIGIESETARLPLLGVSALVGCVGIGLLAASKIAGRRYQEDGATDLKRRNR